MFEFVTRWLVCLVLLAVVVQSERTIKDTADNLFEKRQAMFVWLFINVCLVVCTAVVMGVEMMKICDIERKEINFGCLECGDVFELNGEILMKASVKLSISELSGGINLKSGEFLQIDELFPVKMVNAHLQLED